MGDRDSLILGIDVGTTSIKLSLLNGRTREVVENVRSETAAYVSDEQLHMAEQDVGVILSVLEQSLGQLSSQNLAAVARIEICGQMHGCMLWTRNSCWKWQSTVQAGNSTTTALRASVTEISRLITWEDRRCNLDFLSTLPPYRNNMAISTGFGCASLFWLQRNDPSVLNRFDKAGTVMDFIVWSLCGLDKPIMSSHNAFSWGYFDMDRMAWELDLLETANFPICLLPKVQKPGFDAGKLQKCFFNIPLGTPVGVASGDFQCTILSTISQPSDAVLNFSTSCQLAVVIPDDTCKPCPESQQSRYSGGQNPSGATQLLPFFQGKKVIAAASLSGGNTIATFVNMLTSWLEDLGIESGVLSKDDIYQKVLYYANKKGSTTLNVVPTLWGERHSPDAWGEVSNISSDNISLGDVGLALCKGLVQNIHNMMSRDFLLCHGVKRIIGTGNALLQNPALQKEIEQIFGLPLVTKENADTSVGAALGSILANELPNNLDDT